MTPSSAAVDDFSVGDVGLQVRYRYQIAPLSDFYLVYTRGGFWNDPQADAGFGDLWSNAWDNVTSESILAKVRYRF